jgi:hypothetical protein
MRNVALSIVMTAAIVAWFAVPQPKMNPSDEAAFATIVESALDSNSPSRLERWHTAQEQIVRLDPNRPSASAPFARSGLFHWTELSSADRQSVTTALIPIMRDDFGRLAEPFFELTGDFAVLRRADPGTMWSMGQMMTIAIRNGRFADYRTFREQFRKRRYLAFEAMRATATAAELIALVPIPATISDTPLLQGILAALQSRAVDSHPVDSNRASALIDFALDHHLQPLDGLQTIGANDPQRARLAIALGTFEKADGIESASAVTDRAQWHRYYVERAVAEMRRHESLHALQYLQKADDGKSPDVTAAMEELQRAVGNNGEAAAVHAALMAKANRVEQWTGRCGDDICDHADGMLWSDGAAFALKIASVQSDNVPPYAEVYTDDALTNEGPVSPSLLARAELLRGIHRVGVRLANPVTRNTIRRRIRVE